MDFGPILPIVLVDVIVVRFGMTKLWGHEPRHYYNVPHCAKLRQNRSEDRIKQEGRSSLKDDQQSSICQANSNHSLANTTKKKTKQFSNVKNRG